MNRTIVIIAVAAIALAVIAASFYHRKESKVSNTQSSDEKPITSALAEGKKSTAAATPSAGSEKKVSIETVRASVMNSANAAQAISEARAKFGPSDSLSYAERDVRVACSMGTDITGSANGISQDSSRMWAIQRLHKQCTGIDELPIEDRVLDFQSPIAIARTQTLDAGLQAARSVIRSSDEMHELYEAGQLLLENSQLSSQQIAGLDPNLSLFDVTKDWAYATELWSCSRNGGCGPENFNTVAFCANAGCSENSSLWDGMRGALPPRDMQAVQALYQWIKMNRG